MKTEYKANLKDSGLEVVSQIPAQECPTSLTKDDNICRTEKKCGKCFQILSIDKFYFKKTENCYYSNCKECLKKTQREYNVTKKLEISIAKKKYHENNYTKIKERRKFHNINKQLMLKNRRSWENSRLRNDAQFKLRKNLRSRISKAMKKQGLIKSQETELLIGCKISELAKHIESKFEPGMSWENYGKWHVDHIFPLSKADLTKQQDLLMVMSYKNMQPLWAHDNIIKHNKIEFQKLG